MDFRLTSPAFADGAIIPDHYTCKGKNVSPPFGVTGTPGSAASLALILHDPDAPSGDFLHWTMWNVPANITAISENTLPSGALTGMTDFGEVRYGGPCPHAGTHHYVFDLYALDVDKLPLQSGATRQALQDAIQGHVLAQTSLTGLFSA
jgi:Raf kinase inhibitor-like YbhB/YbcL family protein